VPEEQRRGWRAAGACRLRGAIAVAAGESGGYLRLPAGQVTAP